MGIRLLGKKGTVLTTNPLQSDVRSGMQFQSTDFPLGTNGTNEFNAQITSGIITPPSAYALGIEALGRLNSDTDLNMASIGATYIDPLLVLHWGIIADALMSPPAVLNFSNNALTRGNILNILTQCADGGNPLSDFELSVSGGTNAVLDIPFGRDYYLPANQAAAAWIFIPAFWIASAADQWLICCCPANRVMRRGQALFPDQMKRMLP